jgi:hypothetical protein
MPNSLVPAPWAFVILALAAYRLTRLGGWDDFPPIAAARAWLLRESWVTADGVAVNGLASTTTAEVELPGKTPSTPVPAVFPTYGRPILAHLVHCPFCLGWWVSFSCYLAWALAGEWALVPLAPFAISGVVGLVAKNLDP